MSSYVLVNINCGEVNIETVSKEVLLSRLNTDESGDSYYGSNVKILDQIPTDIEWVQGEENSLIIIEGGIVVPKSVEVVTKYNF